MAWKRRLPMMVVLVLALTGLAMPPASSAPPLESHACGDTIDHSIRLANDLSNCQFDGLRVVAPPVEGTPITIDLNGHTIDGNSISDGSDPDPNAIDAGIQNIGVDDVTIKNGTLTDFDDGILITTSGTPNRNHVSRIRAIGNKDNGIHFLAAESSVRKSTLIGNGGNGIEMNGGFGFLIEGNVIEHSGQSGISSTAATSRFLSNRVTGSHDHGIFIDQSRNRVNDNIVRANGLNGIEIDSGSVDTVLKRNTAIGNGFGPGVGDGSGLGIDATGTTGTVAAGNVASLNDNTGQCAGLPVPICA